ncbi:MAG: hypothetical protein HYY93_14430 [Planctomycetes bacterium]|nr:hypothetical protein [Planctomycetota bacterium]
MSRLPRRRSTLALLTTIIAVVLTPLHACVGGNLGADPCGRVCPTGHLTPGSAPSLPDGGHGEDCVGCTLAVGVPVFLQPPPIGFPPPREEQIFQAHPHLPASPDFALPESRGPPRA